MNESEGTGRHRDTAEDAVYAAAMVLDARNALKVGLLNQAMRKLNQAIDLLPTPMSESTRNGDE